MDIFLVIGIIVGLASVIVGMIVKGANVAVLLNPAAAIIILIGTTAAVMNSFPRKEFLNIPKIVGALFRENSHNEEVEIINKIVEMAQLARKEGLMALEQAVAGMNNKFLQKGLGMVVDGIQPEYVRDVLNTEIECLEERHRACASIFSTAGSASPTLGVLGAVIGLIGALGNLNDTEKLGHMISAAFVATLYGIFLGYVVCHPFASRLKRKSQEEVHGMNIILEGILSIQAGENPKSIEVKLVSMLEPKQRIPFEKSNSEKH
ncbi:MAG TPA: flagellar motor stator protein MotA [Negativicutes bacterium]|nr:flagellar motor stator protein MotA [Negativicutes bacterium]